jgi:hypothetical protein
LNIKPIIVGIILILLSFNIFPFASSTSTNRVYSIYIDNIGTLFGYVRDTNMNPIEGAKIIVYFHDSYEENYSDSNGYYNVNNIPICFCQKNATVYKTGYKSDWVLLAIGKNTIYNFTLIPTDNLPPETPLITGPSSCKVDESYNYTIVTTDPDGDEVSNYVDWGDGNTGGWTRMLPSGEEYNVSHIWGEEGNCIIKVKAKDSFGAESDWATLEVTVPSIMYLISGEKKVIA